jgi:hypothetical protein
MDKDGVIRFADGDWVKLAIDPMHYQADELLDAFMILAQNRPAAMSEVMNASIVALIEDGAVTPRDGGPPVSLRRGPDLKPTPEALAVLRTVSQATKITPIWNGVLRIREGLPSPNLLRAK